mmetsp:Transcript_12961/g.22923  ORF Transcript_12961/g.22923 Transcript_12961/m.22923 type:complete len:102 (+) Transcript_12961:295-600(+)
MPGAVAVDLAACITVGAPTGRDGLRCVTSDWLRWRDVASITWLTELGAAALAVPKGLNSGDLAEVNTGLGCMVENVLTLTVTAFRGYSSGCAGLHRFHGRS